MLEVCIEDRDTADGKGHGVIRELTTGVYGCQGALTFGDSGTSTTSYFQDSNAILSYENRQIADDKYYLKVEGHTSSTNSFELSGATITSAGPNVFFEADNGNINTLTLAGCSFVDLGRTIKFSSNADASGHEVSNCTINACGVVTIGAVGDFSDNTITNPTLFGPQSAATHMPDGIASANTIGISVAGYNGGYGLYIDSSVTGTIQLEDWDFDQSGTDIYWAGAAGTLTINLIGTTNASTTGSSGGGVVLVSTTNFTLTGLKSDGVPGTGSTEVRIYDSGLTQELAGQEDVTTGTFTYQYGTSEQQDDVVVQIHHVQYETIRLTVNWDGIDASIPIQQQFDRNYNNP